MISTNSDHWYKELKERTPNGTQTLSKSPERYVNGVYPKVLVKGQNGHVWDADNNEFIDYIAGLGCISLGYTDPLVTNWVMDQLRKGVSFSLPNPIEALVCKELTNRIPAADQWKFTKTGSDADSMAVKCARAYTCRDKIMVLGYHGWHDWYSIANDKKAGIPLAFADYVKKARYGVIEDLEDLKTEQYAALIMEPMVFDEPAGGYLHYIRDLCTLTGTVFILDEVVTGGRFEGFAAQNYFGVRPDLTVLSKGLANGYPFAAVGGKKSVMSTFERDDFFASTTFGGECVSLTACLATLTQIDSTINETVKNGQRIKDAFNRIFEGDAVCKGYPTRTSFDFPTKEHKALFWQGCIEYGILFGYSNFIMASHDLKDIAVTIGVMEISAKEVKANWANPISRLRGDMPVEPLRMRT